MPRYDWGMAPRRPRRRSLPIPALIGAAGGILLLAAVFLPWYRTNLGAPTSAGTASGWEATGIGKAVVALAAIWLFAALLAVADDLGSVRVDAKTIEGLGYLVALCATLATGLVALRFARPPGPNPDFLSRDYGLVAAVAACAIGIVAGAIMAARRS